MRQAPPLVFSVPSGNFGDLMGAVLARQMGLPVRRLIVAVNANDAFPRFLAGGRYLDAGNHLAPLVGTFVNRAVGPYAWAYWTMIFCNVVSPQLFWIKKCRTSIPILFTLSIVVNIGMWFERFVIIVTSLHRDFLPSAWGYFRPTMWDVSCLLGSFGLFFTMFCLFVRFVPMVATAEVKTVLPQADPHHEAGPERAALRAQPAAAEGVS